MYSRLEYWNVLENGVFPKEVNWVVSRNKGIWATRRREEGTGNILPKREPRGQFYLLYIFSKLMLWKTLFNSQSIFIASSLNTWNLVKLSKRNLPIMLCNASWTTSKSCVPLNVNNYTQIPKSYMRQIEVYPKFKHYLLSDYNMPSTPVGAGNILENSYKYPWPQGAHVLLGTEIGSKRINMESM